MSLPTNREGEFDLIFAGGGASACLTAGRLIAADRTLKILVLEQGPSTLNDLRHIQPAHYWSHITKPTSKTVTFNVGKPSPALNNRQPVVPSGRCVGGGSSVNFTVYTRASASDYDDWEQIHKNPGWGSRDLIPLLKKTENYQIKPEESTHGYSGPLAVSYGGIFGNVGQAFLKVAETYDPTRPIVEDMNNMHECNAYARWPKWIDSKTGKRSDPPHHLLYPHPEIELRANCKVKRIIIEEGRAVGVEYIDDSVGIDASVVVRCSKMVVVAAGAFGSPTILQRSGIGSKEVLERNGVRQIVDLPGVGQNYQDHNIVVPAFIAAEDTDTLCAFFRNEEAEVAKLTASWTKDGSGLLANNGLDAGIKIRPNAKEVEDLGPSFAARWKYYLVNSPDKCMLLFGPLSGFYPDPKTAPSYKCFSMICFTGYPESMGYVNITSGEDVHAPHEFHPGYLEVGADLAILCWGYKRLREFARRMDVYRGEFIDSHPKFANGSEATVAPRDGPVPIETPDIVYTAEDDKAIEDWVRDTVGTSWHSMGTCAMKPREEGGVVDSRLDVYGVRGLKVADISIGPGNVGANTYSTALVIGEKAALIIGEELGIKGV